MRMRLLTLVGVAALVLGAVVVFTLVPMTGAGQAPDGSEGAANTARTPWGDPDLQGIWTDQYRDAAAATRPVANKETFTDEERADARQAAGRPAGSRPARRARQRRDVAGAYNAVFHVGQADRPAHVAHRRSAGRPHPGADARGNEAERRRSASSGSRCCSPRETCKNKEAACAGGKYGPPSPRRNEAAPALQHRPHESQRRPGRPQPGRALLSGCRILHGVRRAFAASCSRPDGSRSSTTSARARACSASSS